MTLVTLNDNRKNLHQYAKVLMWEFEDPEADWQEEGGDHWKWAKPVYRKPQSSWDSTTGFNKQKVWIASRSLLEDMEPEDLEFPDWFHCYWDTQAGRWSVIQPSTFTNTQFIRFIFEEPSSSTKQQNCFWVELSGTSSSSAPATPPTPEGANIFFYGEVFDVEAEPYGQQYYTHLWMIEFCHTPGDEFDDLEYYSDLSEYVTEQTEWEGNIGSMDCTDQAKQQLINEKLTTPVSYERTITTDVDPPECEEPDIMCPLSTEPGTSVVAKVISRPCGIEKVAGEDEEGRVTVVDSTGRFLAGVPEEKYLGKQGFAVYVFDDDPDVSGDTSECYWMITWIEPDIVQLVEDVIIGTSGITIKRIQAELWRWCRMPNETIDGTTCDDVAGSS